MPEIKIENLKVGYIDKKNELIVLDDFNAKFKNAKFNVILGESGCGKTTLLKTIIGFYDYDGKIYFDGLDIADTKVSERNISYVAQNYALYPHLTVFDNIAFPLKVIKAPREEIIERVNDIAKKLQISECLTRKPKALSGGQIQRVAIARALIKRPSLILFDEPLSNLDPEISAKIRILLKSVTKDMGITAIYVTHNFEDAFALADEMYFIKDGKIELSGSPDEIIESNNELLSYYKKKK